LKVNELKRDVELALEHREDENAKKLKQQYRDHMDKFGESKAAIDSYSREVAKRRELLLETFERWVADQVVADSGNGFSTTLNETLTDEEQKPRLSISVNPETSSYYEARRRALRSSGSLSIRKLPDRFVFPHLYAPALPAINSRRNKVPAFKV
jgi:hypothetical protein